MGKVSINFFSGITLSNIDIIQSLRRKYFSITINVKIITVHNPLLTKVLLLLKIEQ